LKPDLSALPSAKDLGASHKDLDKKWITSIASNYSSTQADLLILLYPLAEEASFLAATRVVPPAYPFVVKSIQYLVAGSSYPEQPADEVHCHTGVPHRVELYAGKSLRPEDKPRPLEVLKAPEHQPPDEQVRSLELVLQNQVKLEKGESLFIAVEMARGNGMALCLFVNSGSVTPDANYWSSSFQPPYAWQNLNDYFTTGDLVIRAVGKIPGN
jgi:hypothetical protein